MAGVRPADNVQIRIWGDVDGRRQLVFDRTFLPPSATSVLAEFAAGEITPVPPLDEVAEQERAALGGPFDTDHALMVATAKAGLKL